MTTRGTFKRAWWWQELRKPPACAQAEHLFDHTEIDIACPMCGHETTQTVGWLHTYDEVACPQCRTRFRVDSAQAIRALRARGHRTDDAPTNGFDPWVPL